MACDANVSIGSATITNSTVRQLMVIYGWDIVLSRFDCHYTIGDRVYHFRTGHKWAMHDHDLTTLARGAVACRISQKKIDYRSRYYVN